ncbi:hypothetical protein IFVP18_C130355 [Vibrio parahaemolyticus]
MPKIAAYSVSVQVQVRNNVKLQTIMALRLIDYSMVHWLFGLEK